ncbi:MAG: type VI secretion system membrane subunit TssM [Moraxellaceae bacterium]|nr:MAG: type VI secretion system membrane subunit TssM [Moraxellaceae bacterium]
MKSRFSFLKEKWFIGLLGVTALSILVWFVGPLIAIADVKFLTSDIVRLIIIMVLLLLWGLNNLRTTRAAKKNNENLEKELMESQALPSINGDFQGETQSAGEAEIITSRFNDALTVLRKRQPGKKWGKNFLYELPWYILIGPPGSGKTTALVNSGLEFPLENTFGKEALKGIGGTRHCDWWFTDQAVIIDTAGRYTTQDSHKQADAGAWNNFIELLKKHRKRRPINGVIVAISLQELVSQTEAELAANVRAVRARLQELKDQLGIDFPVYLNFTKCDLIEGFSAFFDSLGKEERAQVWGMTFPDDGSVAYEQQFDQEFDQLVLRLHENINNKLHFERDVRRRTEILSFPRSLESCKYALKQFVGHTFSESRFHDQYLLRGVYFSSGTQNSNALGRVLSQQASSIGVGQEALLGMQQPNQQQGRSYFIRNLMQQVIFPESQMVGTNRKHERKMRWLQSGGIVCAVSSIVIGALLWSTSFGKNDLRLRDASERLFTYEQALEVLPEKSLPETLLPMLSAVQSVATVYPADEDDWLLGLGLYQGHALQEQSAQNYDAHLQHQFSLALKHQLAQQLVQERDNPDFLHQGLKAYLMLADGARFDEDFIETWLTIDWDNRYHTQPDVRNGLREHLNNWLLQPYQVQDIDMDLVERTRKILRRIPLHEQVYASIKLEAREKYIDGFRFDVDLGGNIEQVFQRADYEVPRLYTFDGYDTVYKPAKKEFIESLSNDNWVVGSRSGELTDMDLATVQAKLEKQYLEDYIHHWSAAINQLRLVPMGSLEESLEVMNALLSGQSPLREILDTISINTQLSASMVNAEDIKEHAKSATQVARMAAPQLSKFTRLANMAARKRLANLPQNPASLVDKQFQSLHKMVETKRNRPTPLDELNESLVGLQIYLESIAASGSTPENAFDVAVTRMKQSAGDPLGRLIIQSRRYPQPVKRWLTSLLDQSWGLILGQAKQSIVGEYRLSVKPFYDASLKARYPLSKRAKSEVTLSDFSEFFKAGGIEQLFFDQYIAPFVDTKHKPWRLKRVGNRTIGLSKKSLAQFEQAAEIRRVFFASGDEPSLQFSMRPLYLDANVSRFELDMLGQQMRYRHGPSQKSQVSWPADQLLSDISFEFEDYYGARTGEKSEGVWSLFRFIDAHPLKRSSYGGRYKLTMTKDGKKAIYEVSANRAVNPFSKDYLGAYKLPNTL